MDKMHQSNFPLPLCSTLLIQVWQSYIDCLGLGNLDDMYKRSVLCQGVYQVIEKEMDSIYEILDDWPEGQDCFIRSGESMENCIMIAYESDSGRN